MKKTNLLTLALITVLGSSNLFAQNQGFDKQNKNEIIRLMDSQILNMTKLRNCISAANNRDDVNACRETHKNTRKELHKKKKVLRLKHKKNGQQKIQ